MARKPKNPESRKAKLAQALVTDEMYENIKRVLKSRDDGTTEGVSEFIRIAIIMEIKRRDKKKDRGHLAEIVRS